MNTDFRLMPEQASSMAADVDQLYLFLIIVSAILTVSIAFALFYLAIKYRRNSPADRTRTESHFLLVEVSWIVGPFIMTMIMFVWGARLFYAQTRPAADAMVINCVGRQWMWKFQHPDGRSEINDLHVPLNQPVRVNMISDDVIHSLYVPAFRVKQDVLPGRYSSISFTANKVGQYHLFCAEYCGAKHSGMVGTVSVLEPAAYQRWLEGRTADAALSATGRLFDQLRCNACHLGGGENGRGPSLQNLFGKNVVLQNGQTVVADDDYLRESILRPTAKIVAGYEPLMPSFDEQVTEEGVLQLIAEIKALGRGTEPTVTSDGSANQPAGLEQKQPPVRNEVDPGAPREPEDMDQPQPERDAPSKRQSKDQN